eukprot:2213265-Prymnesium_polylepis.1
MARASPLPSCTTSGATRRTSPATDRTPAGYLRVTCSCARTSSSARDGMYYKWLPLVISTESTYAVDRKKALLALRGVDARTQNACFNQLYAVAGVEMYAGDA